MKMHVQTPFTLTKDDGEQVSFSQGVQDIADDLADHWYVKAHAEPVEDKKSEPKSGSTKTKTEG